MTRGCLIGVKGTVGEISKNGNSDQNSTSAVVSDVPTKDNNARFTTVP